MKALLTIRALAYRVIARVTAGRLTAASDDGMTTAEYAMGTVAACGFAGVLYKLITSDLVMALLKAAISRAFNLSF